MCPKSPLFIASLFALLWASAPCPAQGGGADCSIEVGEPRSGQPVGREILVEGTARLPPDHHLWVFARRGIERYRNARIWWLQGEGSVDEQGRWSVLAAIGDEHDRGAFDIAVAAFAEEQHQRLAEDYARILTTTDLSARTIPAAACSAEQLVVEKTSHK